MGSGDDSGASLLYVGDDLGSYQTIWDGAKFATNEADQRRLVESLKKIDAGEDLDEVVDVESVLRYFVVHNFVVNFDSYTGNMQHNYYLYEEDGRLSMIPWDYNLAFGSFGGGMGVAGRGSGATEIVNFPIDTPVSGATLEERPILGKLLAVPEYLSLYHEFFDEFISEYFESGKFEDDINDAVTLISEYVKSDPTAFYTFEEFQKGVDVLEEFCLLRATSIRGQLDGSISSTSQMQSRNGDSLVDADHLTLSDMGTMNVRGGFDLAEQAPRPQAPQDRDDVLSEAPFFDPTSDEIKNAPSQQSGFSDGKEKPDFIGERVFLVGQGTDQRNRINLFIISVAVLAIGIVFAK